MKLLIEVTQKDIEEGVAMDCKSCPVALACMRHIDKVPGVISVEAATDLILFKGLKRYVCTTPAEAGKFINRFDVGIRVKPFSFELEIPA